MPTKGHFEAARNVNPVTHCPFASQISNDSLRSPPPPCSSFPSSPPSATSCGLPIETEHTSPLLPEEVEFGASAGPAVDSRGIKSDIVKNAPSSCGQGGMLIAACSCMAGQKGSSPPQPSSYIGKRPSVSWPPKKERTWGRDLPQEHIVRFRFRRGLATVDEGAETIPSETQVISSINQIEGGFFVTTGEHFKMTAHVYYPRVQLILTTSIHTIQLSMHICVLTACSWPSYHSFLVLLPRPHTRE